jgi:hypothetical protein
MIGHGTLFAFRDAGTQNAYTTVGRAKDIKVPGMEVAFESATVQESPNDAEEFEPTLLMSGNLSFSVLYEATDPTHLNAAGGIQFSLRTKQKTDGQITFRNGKSVSFTGWFSKWETSAPIKGLVEASVEFKVTGLPTYP